MASAFNHDNTPRSKAIKHTPEHKKTQMFSKATMFNSEAFPLSEKKPLAHFKDHQTWNHPKID